MATRGSSLQRATRWATLGLAGSLPRGAVREGLDAIAADPDPLVRAAALGALIRRAGTESARRGWTAAASDPDPGVRRRAAELAPKLSPPPVRALTRLLADPEPLVTETAAWALGECPRAQVAVARLATLATGHDDPLVREAAVAALGAIGDERGLEAVLAATSDKPTVRRRAVLALAPFEGPHVDEALERAARDRDWQVRDAAAVLGVTNTGD